MFSALLWAHLSGNFPNETELGTIIPNLLLSSIIITYIFGFLLGLLSLMNPLPYLQWVILSAILIPVAFFTYAFFKL
jgi:hypothetical protein